MTEGQTPTLAGLADAYRGLLVTRMTFSAQRWCTMSQAVSGPVPPKPQLNAMLDELTAALTFAKASPGGLAVESWPRPEGLDDSGASDFLARITVTAQPGLPARSFRSWFQWRHPQWTWSQAPFPAGKSFDDKAIEGEVR